MSAHTALVPAVIELVHKTPGVTADDLVPHCPGHTRKQIMSALHWAKNTKRLRCEPQYARGPGRSGPSPARFYPAEVQKAEQAVNSVWQYAQNIGATT